jgi:hypothetical protein
MTPECAWHRGARIADPPHFRHGTDAAHADAAHALAIFTSVIVASVIVLSVIFDSVIVPSSRANAGERDTTRRASGILRNRYTFFMRSFTRALRRAALI